MSTTSGTEKLVLLGSLVLGLLIYINKKRRSLPYPPGPKKLPLIGNLHQLPTSYEWETYARWGKELNTDILHLRAGGQDLIVINSYNVANDLFDKRSSIYSSRPKMTMINELMGWDWFMVIMAYGDRWRARRRLFTKYFQPSNISRDQPGITECIRKMMPRLLDNPDGLLTITRHMIGEIALSLAYGISIKESNDPLVNLVEQAAVSFTQATVPGAFWVDMMPFLKHVPEFLPGASFKRKARVWRKLQEDMREVPFKQSVKNMTSETCKKSFTSTNLENMDESADITHQKEVIKDTAGIVFGAAADTTTSATHSFFLAMLCFPQVQKKAQEELDRVLGGRLPDFSDEPDLPYIAALVKEVIRWRATTPIAIPHLASEDDVYRGYHIPKGALVIGNVWAMLNDDETYPDPSAFNPERFLKDGQLDPSIRDPSLMAFGFGRRTCPGGHIALSALWLTATMVLSTLNITKALDKDGVPIEPSSNYMSGLICHPEPFKCTIRARSKGAEDLIRSAADIY